MLGNSSKQNFLNRVQNKHARAELRAKILEREFRKKHARAELRANILEQSSEQTC
jgi:hypothetical protein